MAVCVGPQVYKQYTLNALNASKRTAAGSLKKAKDQDVPPCIASIKAKRPKKVTRYQGQNQGEPKAQ